MPTITQNTIDKHKTQMIFRIWPDDTIDALFPYEISSGYDVTCYAHVGQHSGADYDHVISSTKAATPKQYKELHGELTGRGYTIEVVKRRNYDRYIAVIKAAVKERCIARKRLLN